MKKTLFMLFVAVLMLLLPLASAEDPISISSWADLDNIRNNLAADYILINDLISSTPGYDDFAGPEANEGEGWEPIGNESQGIWWKELMYQV